MIKDLKKTERRTQERAQETKRKLIQAAMLEFSGKGFDSVTTRDIEKKAQVQRGLLTYHFGDKAGIWKAVIDSVFQPRIDQIKQQGELAQDLTPRERLAFRIRSFVRYSAERPELNRLMVQEGKNRTWRTDYIIDTYLKDVALALGEMCEDNLALDEETFVHWYYIFIGAGAFVFSVAPEAEAVFGVNVRDKDFVERHTNLTVKFLLEQFEDFGGKSA